MLAGIIQLSSTRDIDDNLRRCRQLGEQALARGARWLLYPENAPFLGRDRDKLSIAEDLDGPMVAHFKALARDGSCWVSLGSFPERSPSPDHTLNTQLLISPEGEITATYRKMHLFDVELPGGGELRESASILAGDEIVAADLEHAGQAWRVGLSICYDLRFPELYRRLLDEGAELLTVPSAFTLQTGHEHWHTLLRARAIENQCYVLAPNQWGHHFEGRASYGQSVAYDPWGRQLACAPERDCALVVELAREDLERTRRRMPCASHRKL